jgi:hypothetical protein
MPAPVRRRFAALFALALMGFAALPGMSFAESDACCGAQLACGTEGPAPCEQLAAPCCGAEGAAVESSFAPPLPAPPTLALLAPAQLPLPRVRLDRQLSLAPLTDAFSLRTVMLRL